MKLIKTASLCLAFLILSTLTFSSCSSSTGRSTGPEVGVWKAEYHLKDLNTGSLSDEERMILTLLGGNVLFSVEMEFAKNGDFSYRMNTDDLEQALSNSINKIAGWFIKFDISVFTERLLRIALDEVMEDYQKTYIGSYTASGTDLTADCEGNTFSFSYHAGTIVQYDGSGKQYLLFNRAE